MKTERIIYIIILVLAGALAFLTGRQIFLVAVLVLAVWLLLAGIYAACAGRRTELALFCDVQCGKGEEKEAVLEVRNRSILPLLRLEICLGTENLLTGQKTEMNITCIAGPKRTRRIPFSLGDKVCGCLELRAVSARSGDPLRLFFRKIPAEYCKGQMLVLPALSGYPLSAANLEGYDMESFRYADGKTGTDSSETVGIRDYLPGDSVRAIHWKLSAKTGDVLVKEFGYPVETRLMVIAEKSLRMEEPQRIGALTELSLSVLDTLLQMGIEHTFGWYHCGEGMFLTRKIAEPEDLFRLMPEFLSSPVSAQKEDSAFCFLESGEENNYAGYVYITEAGNTEVRGLERLRDYGQVTVLTPESFQ